MKILFLFFITFSSISSHSIENGKIATSEEFKSAFKLIMAGSCTAVKVDSNKFLTAKHCVSAYSEEFALAKKEGRASIFEGLRSSSQFFELYITDVQEHEFLDLAIATIEFPKEKERTRVFEEMPVAVLPNNNLQFESTKNVKIGGYGVTSKKASSTDILLVGEAKLSSNIEHTINSLEKHKDNMTEYQYNQYLAYLPYLREIWPLGGSMTLNGDSGAPVYDFDQDVVIGIVQGGNKSCKVGKFFCTSVGIFTRLDHEDVISWLANFNL